MRTVQDHEAEHPPRWAAVISIAGKIGRTAQTLNGWVKKAELDSGRKPGLTTDMATKLKALERENRELDVTAIDPLFSQIQVSRQQLVFERPAS